MMARASRCCSQTVQQLPQHQPSCAVPSCRCRGHVTGVAVWRACCPQAHQEPASGLQINTKQVPKIIAMAAEATHFNGLAISTCCCQGNSDQVPLLLMPVLASLQSTRAHHAATLPCTTVNVTTNSFHLQLLLLRITTSTQGLLSCTQPTKAVAYAPNCQV